MLNLDLFSNLNGPAFVEGRFLVICFFVENHWRPQKGDTPMIFRGKVVGDIFWDSQCVFFVWMNEVK